MGEDREDRAAALEDAIRGHARAGRLERAATVAVDGYGAEVLGFLHAVLATSAEADDAFSAVCERMWKGLPGFGWRCTFRTWLYAIARNVANRQAAVRGRDRARVVPLGDEAPELAKMANRIRTSTALYLKTKSKARLREIRESLESDERTLLVLRIDRGLSWREIAVVMDGEALDEEALEKTAVRLRQRFARLKAKVAERMRSG